jgi:hypothetical protein
LAVQPDAVADVRRQLPALGESLAGDHVIQADDRALDVGDVAAEHLGGFDRAAKALGQHRFEDDLPQVVQQPADERLERLDLRCPCPSAGHLLGQQLRAAADGDRVLPVIVAVERLPSASAGRERRVHADGDDRLAQRLEPARTRLIDRVDASRSPRSLT